MPLPTTNLTFHVKAATTAHVWKEDAMSTHPADGEGVDAWDDEDGGAFALFSPSGVAGTLPLYRTALLNGNGSIDFDGTNDELRVYPDASTGAAAWSDFVTAGAGTIFIAFQLEADALNDASTFLNSPLVADDAQSFGIYVKTSAGVHTLMGFVYDGADKHADKTFTRDTPHVAMITLSGGVLTIDIDNSGAPVSTSGVGNISNLTGRPCVGSDSARFFPGKIGEIAFYNAGVSGADLAQAWADLLATWVTAPLVSWLPMSEVAQGPAMIAVPVGPIPPDLPQ